MKKILQRLIIIISLLLLLQIFIQPALAEGGVVLDYFYNDKCHSCVVPIKESENGSIWYIGQIYGDKITINLKLYNDQNYSEEYKAYIDNYDSLYIWPFLVIKTDTNETVMPKLNITVEDMKKVINAYLIGLDPDLNIDEDAIPIDFLFWKFQIDSSEISLPVLTIILAGVDSFNPCVFFILIFLLNLLIYAKSRRRMILIGGIFIFFSAFIYFLFMVLLLNAFQLTLEIGVTAYIIGAIAIILGVINIKDFFFSKKGISISIPEDKKPKIYKRMRNLIRTPQVSGVLIGTIILAIVVNFYELICSLTLPAIFTSKLALSNLTDIERYLYIFFYNVIYVIPMIIIVLIFVVTLGRRKLSEWHGQILKLLSGVMMASFGILFIIDFSLLENVATPILLLIFTLVSTFVISAIWKKYKIEKDH